MNAKILPPTKEVDILLENNNDCNDKFIDNYINVSNSGD